MDQASIEKDYLEKMSLNDTKSGIWGDFNVIYIKYLKNCSNMCFCLCKINNIILMKCGKEFKVKPMQ